MDIRLKAGVRARGISPVMVIPIIIAREIYSDVDSPLVITSITDGQHRIGSLHYVGDALDLRLPKTDPNRVIARLRDALGGDFDVVLETDHIHIEYDPVRP